MKKLQAWLKGRSSRTQFWLASGVLWLGFYFLSSLVSEPSRAVAAWVINVPTLALLLGLCVRRLHDLNRSGWWLMAILIPVVGALWLLWQLALKTGVAFDNRWGAGNRDGKGDHLTVQ